LDADDVWLPEKLEKQVALMQRHPEIDVLMSPFYYWFPDGGKAPQQMTLVAGKLQPGILIPKILVDGDNAAAPSCVMMKWRFATEVGGFDETAPNLVEDQAMWLKATVRGATIYYDPNYLVLYRVHDSSCCKAASERQTLDAHVWLYSKLIDLLRDCRDSRLNVSQLTKTARYKLCDTLRQLADHLTLRNGTSGRPSRLSRIRVHWLLLRSYRWALGPACSGLLLLHGVSKKLTGKLSSWIVPVRRGSQNRADLERPPQPQVGSPPVGQLAWGGLRRLEPISRTWGFDRGRPVDRYYIEAFLARNAADVRGRVLEIGDDSYTRQYGGDRVTCCDVFDIAANNPRATIVGDLAQGDQIPSNTFDCLIVTQTLYLIYDFRASLQTVFRILKPGGVLLLTTAGITRVSHTEWPGSSYWSFTGYSIRRLLEEVFPAASVAVDSHGNVLTAISFLHGLAVEELLPEELDYRDPDYEVILTARAVKPM
jgi:hypothetical protein